ILFEFPEIEHVVADRNPNARRQTILRREHAIGQVLDREVGGRIDRDERTERGSVGGGHCFRFCCGGRSSPPSPCGRGWLRCTASQTGEGFVSTDTERTERDPSSGASRHLLPQGEKGR